MTFVMFITTLLTTLAILVVWHCSIFVSLAFLLIFGLIDGSFLSATLNKFEHGGWFPSRCQVHVCLFTPSSSIPRAYPCQLCHLAHTALTSCMPAVRSLQAQVPPLDALQTAE